MIVCVCVCVCGGGCLVQAVSKLAEIMNKKDPRGGGSRRGNETDLRRKEKENRKLQLELRTEKEKLNSTIIKYQKEINEMQAVQMHKHIQHTLTHTLTAPLSQ